MIHSYKTPYRLCKNPFCLGHLIAFTTLSNGAQVYKPYGICARKKDYTDTMDILLNDVFSVVPQKIWEIQILSCISRLSSDQIWTTIPCLQNKLLLGSWKTFLREAGQPEVDILQ